MIEIVAIKKIEKYYNKYNFVIGKHFVKAKKSKKFDRTYVTYADGYDNFGKKSYTIRLVGRVCNDGSFCPYEFHRYTKDYYQKWRADKLYDRL